MLLRMIDGQAKTNFNIVRYQGNQTSEVLAKLIIGSPITQVNQQLMNMGCGGYRTYTRVHLQILNPDLTPYHFHGKNWSLTLMFVLDQDDVHLPCV